MPPGNAPPDTKAEPKALPDLPHQPIAATLPPLPLPLPVQTPSDSGDETDDYFGAGPEQKAAVHSSEEEYSDSGTGSKRKKPDTTRRRSGISGGAANTGKRRKAVIEDEDEREERRKQSSVEQSRFYNRGGAAPAGEQTAENNKTRKHAIDQLEMYLKAIFALPTPASTSTAVVPALPTPQKPTPEQAREHASKVEADLFLNFHEIDEKDRRTKVPGRKYISKFRTLNFNLKGNDYFRSRIAAGLLDAAAIVNMSQDDLLTPEARAAQEAAKNKSLAQSVKAAVVQPTTRFTKKGEEVLDEFDATGTKVSTGKSGAEGEATPITGNDSSFISDIRERSRSMSLAAGSPGLEQSPRFGSPPAIEGMSPTASQSPFPRAFSPVEMGPPSAKPQAEPSTPISAAPEPTTAERRPSLVQHSRSDSQSKSKIDLDSIWGAYKAPAPKASESPAKEAEESEAETKAENDMDLGDSDGEKEEKKEEERVDEFDPFSQGSKRDTDEDFDAIMNADQPGAVKAEAAAVEEDKTASLPTVWSGAIIHPDEGGFPARIVQVSGPKLGVHPQIWSQILPPKQIDINGRIEVKAASDYLVQAHFAPKRELAILALIPDGEPDAALADASGKPSVEKAERGFKHLVNYFHEKKRFGVCPPTDALKIVTKDHYIVPLKKDDPLPDYVELLDDFLLGDTGSRTQDYLLSVLVLSKGAWQGAGAGSMPARPSGSSTPLQSQPASNSPGHDPRSQPGPVPAASASQPPIAQQMGHPNLPALDPSALQNLLANPGLFQALQAGPPAPALAQQGPGFGQSPRGMQQQQSGMPFGPGGMPQNSPPWAGGPPPQQQWQGPPPPGNWNPAGSPQWQGGGGGPQGRGGGSGPGPGPGGWGSQQGPAPGFIHPDRIKQASREAAEMAAREQRGGGGGRGGYRDDRYDDRRGSSGRDSYRDNDRGGDYRRSDGPGNRDRGDRRPRNSDYTRGPAPPPPQQRGNGNGGGGGQRDREGSGQRDQRSGSSNQMHAGIADRGWGNRG